MNMAIRRSSRHFNRRKTGATLVVALLLLLSAALSLPAMAADVEISFLYLLADFTGAIPFTAVPVAVDEARGEVYVADNGENSVRVFNEQGMEVFRFGDDDRLGLIYDLAILDGGDILLLSNFPSDREPRLVRCNFRGEPQGQILLSGMPETLGRFHPSRMLRRGERLYFFDPNAMRVVATGLDGKFVKDFDLASLAGIDRQKGKIEGAGGFDIDAEGNLVFTVPTMFLAFHVSPEGNVRGFGRPGSSPGKFGVINGIAADRDGFVYVVDTLRCVVLVFDENLEFRTEFGYRQNGPGGLVAPSEVVVTPSGRIFVTQRAKRGVNVYHLNHG